MLLTIGAMTTAQDVEQKFDIPVIENGVTLSDPWIGGMNLPMYLPADLNNDGTEDLVIFELKNGRTYTYLYENNDYKYHLEYQDNFPANSSWIILEDYNCDGITDLFGFNENFSTAIYKGYFDADNRLAFEMVIAELYDDLGDKTFADTDDPIKVLDIDNDGDLDILTVSEDAQTMFHYENLSQDMGYGCDSLIFNFQSPCWGDFRMLTSLDGIELNIDCDVNLTDEKEKDGIHVVPKISVIDMDGDTDKDLLIGYVLDGSLNLLENTGSPDIEEFDAIQTNYPFDEPIDFPNAVTTFHLDIDKDGTKDLLASRGRLIGNISFGKVDMYYRNTGTDAAPQFEYQQDDLLSEHMIDVGRLSKPAIGDYNNDGLDDLIITSHYGVGASTESNYLVSLYENVGTNTEPAFELITEDFAGLGTMALPYLKLTFGDLDDDGDDDFIFGYQTGVLIHYRNDGGVFTMIGEVGEDIGLYSAPELIDINQDGLLDLIVGEGNGNLNYFENVGTTTNPVFNLVTDFWGQIDVREPGSGQGHSVPALYEYPDTADIELLVGNFQGKVKRYDFDYQVDYSDIFNLLNQNILSVTKNNNSNVVLGDFDNDSQLDIIEGNSLGGLTYFEEKDLFVTTNSPQNEGENIYLISNFVTGQLKISSKKHTSNSPLILSVFDPIGRLKYQQRNVNFSENSLIEINLQNLPSGFYFLQIYQNQSQKNYSFFKI